MSHAHALRCYEYVNQPYESVRDALRNDPRRVFQRATTAGASRAHEVASYLHVDVGALAIGAEVTIYVQRFDETGSAPGLQPVTRLRLAWEAARAPALFPAMQAELAVYALSPGETQLDLSGEYRPPLGAIGAVLDAVVGHRIAEASVHRFLRDLAELLKRELGASAE
jgi:hypothetical protein